MTSIICVIHCLICVFSPSLCVRTDTSGKGLSGVLSVFRDGVELPVAFYSRQLRGAETCYSTSELECLAVVDSVRHFQVYLHGRSFGPD